MNIAGRWNPFPSAIHASALSECVCDVSGKIECASIFLPLLTAPENELIIDDAADKVTANRETSCGFPAIFECCWQMDETPNRVGNAQR